MLTAISATHAVVFNQRNKYFYRNIHRQFFSLIENVKHTSDHYNVNE